MTGPRRIKIEQRRDIAIVRGWRAQDLLREAGIRPIFAGGGWTIDLHRLPDLLAYLERRGVAVEEVADPAPSSDVGTAEQAGPRSAGTCTPRLEDRLAGLPVHGDVSLWGPDGGAA